MAQLRVTVPTLGNSPSQRLSKYHIAFAPSPAPAPVIYHPPSNGRLWISLLLHLSSLYAAHQWISQSPPLPDRSLTKFAFLSFFGASVVLGFLQKPWKGRPISPSQWITLLLSGALLALSFVLRMQGLTDVGPLETILAEYAGAVVGKVLIKSQRKVHGTGEAKVKGALAFLAGLYLLSQGWAVSSCSPLSSLLLPATRTRSRLTRSPRIGFGSVADGRDCGRYLYIMAPICAGFLSSMQKLVPSRTSLESLPRKRMQALSHVTAGAVLIPVLVVQLGFGDGGGIGGGLDQRVVWPLLSMIGLGMVVAFYGEFFSEEKILVSPLSPFHFYVTVCSVCLLELVYGSNFSLLGFVVCSAILAVGVRAGAFISGGLDWNSSSDKEYSAGLSVLSMIKTPVHHIWTDVKTRKIAMFLLLNTSFMVVEFLYGFLSNSLGLISDACHMLFDCAALAIGLYASYISRLPPNSKFNYGYGRFEVLSGFANAVFLILVASLIVLESLERLLEPPEISTESLLLVSVGGFLVNVVGLIFFHEAHHHAHGSAPCTHVHHAPHDKVVPLIASSGFAHTPSSPPGVFRSQLPTQWQQTGLDSPISHLQDSPPRINSYDASLQSSSRESRAADSILDHHHDHNLHFPNGASVPSLHTDGDHADGSQSKHQERAHFGHHHHADNSSPGQLSPQQSHLHAGHQHSWSCSSNHNHHHREDIKAADQSHSHGNHQHSEACRHIHDQGHDHKNPYIHSRDKHQHSEVCSDNHDHRPDQHNPFVHQSHSHDKRLSSETHSPTNDQHHDHMWSHPQPLLQDSSAKSYDQQVGVHIAQHHDLGHGSSNLVPWIVSSNEHQHNSISSVPGEDNYNRRDERHHEERRREVPSSSGADHGAGHSHLHGGQPCSHDHEHQHEGHSGHGHGHSHSNEGDNHHGHSHDDHDHHHHHHHGHHHEHNHDEHQHDHDGSQDDHGHHHIDHNMEGIFLHILADTLGSVGVVISTLLIQYKGWLFTDPACSIFISMLIVSSVLPLVRNSAELLLQRVPRSAEKRIQKALKKVEAVEGVHDWHKLHVWSNTNTELVGTLRLHASIGMDKQLVHKQVSQILREAGVLDLTLEVEELEHLDDQ